VIHCFLYPEDTAKWILRNVRTFLPYYTVSHPIRLSPLRSNSKIHIFQYGRWFESSLKAQVAKLLPSLVLKFLFSCTSWCLFRFHVISGVSCVELVLILGFAA